MRQGSAGSSANTATTGCWPEQPALQAVTLPVDSQQQRESRLEGRRQQPLQEHPGRPQQQGQGQAADGSHTSRVRSCCSSSTDALDHLMRMSTGGSVELSSCSSTTTISVSGSHAGGDCTDAPARDVTSTGTFMRTGMRPRPPDCGVVAMEAAARLAHPNLVPVHVVRAVLLDEQGLAELDLVPTLRPGWGVGARRPPSRLASYLLAHRMAPSTGGLPRCWDTCAGQGCRGAGQGSVA